MLSFRIRVRMGVGEVGGECLEESERIQLSF